jgi:hypothetical protein
MLDHIVLKRLNHIRNDLPSLKNFEQIASSNEVKYLGVILDRKLTYRSHMNKAVRKVNHRLRQFYPILNKFSINIKLALTIYKTLIRLIITYVNPAWGYTARTQISKLQVFQNKVLYYILKISSVRTLKSGN